MLQKELEKNGCEEDSFLKNLQVTPVIKKIKKKKIIKTNLNTFLYPRTSRLTMHSITQRPVSAIYRTSNSWIKWI